VLFVDIQQPAHRRLSPSFAMFPDITMDKFLRHSQYYYKSNNLYIIQIAILCSENIQYSVKFVTAMTSPDNDWQYNYLQSHCSMYYNIVVVRVAGAVHCVCVFV